MLDFLKQKTIEWLRWSEQYTGTDMVYLVKGGGWLTLSKLLSIAGGLVLAIAFANLIPQDTYGTYKFLVSAASIIASFTLSGMGTAVAQAAAQGFNSALRHGSWTKLKWCIGITLVALFAAGYYYLQENLTLCYGMLMIAVLYPFRSSSSVYESFLTGKKDFRRRGIYSISLEGFQVVSMVITLFLTNSVLWIFLVFLVTNTLASIFFYFRTAAAYPQTSEKNESMISYSKHLSVIKIINVMANNIDKVLVWHHLGAVQLAIYAFALRPVSKIRTLLSSVGQAAFPKFSQKRPDVLQNTLPRKVILFALANLCIALMFFVAVPYLYHLLFPKYLESILFAQILGFSIVLYSARMFEKVIEAHAKARWLYVIKCISNVARIIGFVIFLPLYGIWGAVVVIFIVDVLRGAIGFIGFLSLETETEHNND